jgi:cell division protein FtsB
MQPFQERKKLRKILYSKVTLLVLFVACVLVARGAWGVHQKALIADSERNQALKAQEELQGRAIELEASLARLRSDQGVEEELRQKFTVAQPGESVVIVVDETDKTGKNTGVSGSESFWSRVVNFFKL